MSNQTVSFQHVYVDRPSQTVCEKSVTQTLVTEAPLPTWTMVQAGRQIESLLLRTLLYPPAVDSVSANATFEYVRTLIVSVLSRISSNIPASASPDVYFSMSNVTIDNELWLRIVFLEVVPESVRESLAQRIQVGHTSVVRLRIVGMQLVLVGRHKRTLHHTSRHNRSCRPHFSWGRCSCSLSVAVSVFSFLFIIAGVFAYFAQRVAFLRAPLQPAYIPPPSPS